jgi:Co/Zn/Cd efflux system component
LQALAVEASSHTWFGAYRGFGDLHRVASRRQEAGSAVRAHHDNQGHSPDHDHDHGWWRRLGHLLRPHSHDSTERVEAALESSRAGLRALWISLVVLGATAAAQAVVVVWSGSVALLGDTLHNTADALTAVPLGVAFLLGRRPATRRYTYGYGRAKGLAGIAIVNHRG